MFYVNDWVEIVDGTDFGGTSLHPIGSIGEVVHVESDTVSVRYNGDIFHYVPGQLKLHERPVYTQGYVQGLAEAQTAVNYLFQMTEEDIETYLDDGLLRSFTAGEVLDVYTLPYIIEQTKKCREDYEKSLSNEEIES